MLSAGKRVETRVIIASADARLRSALMNVLTQQSETKVVGFIRFEDQLLNRMLVSTPELLLLDAKLGTEHHAAWIGELKRHLPDLQVLIYGADRIDAGLRRQMYGTDAAQLSKGVSLITDGEQDGFRDLQNTFRAVLHPRPASAAARAVQPAARQATSAVTTATGTAKRKPQALVIASSTGGPFALTSLVKMLPRDFPLPVAVVQHMPPGFTTMLAERLNKVCPLDVVEGHDGMEFLPGRMIIGPGDYHITLQGKPGRCAVQLQQGEREHSCRPAANVLFRSAANVFGGSVLTLVLTGMGRDGFEGARQLRELGSRVIVQDAETSTVWGMPGAIAQAGLADAVLPLQDIASELMRSL